MLFQWDRLEPVASVPYVPTVGPVHPATFDASLFEDVQRVAGTGKFLSYDKDRRWARWKDAAVLSDAIEHGPGGTLIPTLARRGTGTVTVHAYGCGPDSNVLQLAAELAAANDTATARVLTFQGPNTTPSNGVASVRVQLRQFAPGHAALSDSNAVKPVANLSDSVRATFASFADRLAVDGFAFLHRQMQARNVGPVLAVTAAAQVVGAIGPMKILPDSLGAARLLPPYFGVLPEHRGQGHGRALWRAAIEWADRHAADYLILQTQTDGSSDRLCQAEGLRSLGFICTTELHLSASSR